MSNEIKVDFITEEEFNEEVKDSKLGISVMVESLVGDLGDKWDDKLEGLVVAHTLSNGTRIYAGMLKYDVDTKCVSMVVVSPCPEYAAKADESICTTFVDFCWLSSEGTNALNKNQVETPYREGYELGDLTWALPARFVDNLIMMVHTMAEIISLDLQEAIIYGPEIINPNSEEE